MCEALIPEGSHKFNPTGKPLAGEFWLAAALDVGLDIEPTSLDATPKLKSFYEEMLSTYFASVKDGLYPYYKKD
jgi:hypothetical protein